MGPPDTWPSRSRRYMTAKVHSASLVDMPRKPATMSHRVAPGPPKEMATATPAMLPIPTVPDTAVVSAWNWLISPGSPGALCLPRTRSTACLKPRMFTSRR